MNVGKDCECGCGRKYNWGCEHGYNCEDERRCEWSIGVGMAWGGERR